MRIDTIWSASESDVYVGGQDATVSSCLYHYNGLSWARVDEVTSPGDAVTSLWGSSASDVFLSTAGGNSYRFDGAFWTPIALAGAPHHLYRITGTSPQNVIATTVLGLARYRGHAWSTVQSFPSQVTFGVAGRSPSELYAVGATASFSALVMERTSAGWTPIAMPPGTPGLRSAWTAPGEPLWVSGGLGGGTGRVLKRPVGLGWTAVTLPPSTPSLTGVHGLPGGNVFIVGGNTATFDQGVALRCSGTTCNATTLPGATPWLVSVWAAAEDDAFAVGMSGTILRWNGTSWAPMSSPATVDEHVMGVWGASASAVWASTSIGRIFFFDGTSWTVQPSGATGTLRALWGRSATDVFAVGTSGKVLHFDGVGWAPVRSPVDGSNMAIWGHGSAAVVVGYDSGSNGHLVQLVGEGSL
jgi:hypothetical protein